MDFDYDMGPAFTALEQPAASSVDQPPSEASTLFDGSSPAVHFGPVTPIEFGKAVALHDPHFKPVYEFHPVHSDFHSAVVHPILGRAVDWRA